MTTASPVFTWNETLAIDKGVIDIQHKGLVRTIGDLQQAMSSGTGAAVLDDVFARMMDYTVVHFTTEEQVMRECNYPLLESHRADHLRLKQTVLTLQQAYRDGAKGVSIELLNLLYGWLTTHIIEKDKAFWAYVREGTPEAVI